MTKIINDWVEGPPVDVQIGEKIEAVIRHCNKKLKLKDERFILITAEDGYYLENGYDELSWNWDIVRWRPLKYENKK